MIFGSKIPPNLRTSILNKGGKVRLFPPTSPNQKPYLVTPFIQLTHPPPLRYNFCHDFWVKNPAKNYGTLSRKSGYKFVMIFGSKIPPNLRTSILNKGGKVRLFPPTSPNQKPYLVTPFIQLTHPPPLRYNFCHDFWVKNPAKNYGTLSRKKRTTLIFYFSIKKIIFQC